MPRPVLAPSVMSSYVEPRFAGTTIASASGFLVKREGKVFLVTNRHVVRGRHQDTDAILDKTHRAIPDSIRVLYLRESQYNIWGESIVRLVDDDGNPLWFEHPHYKGRVDVVAIALAELEGMDVLAYDPWASPHALIDPSERLSIVGFPYGIKNYATLGVWVQGFVATQTQAPHGGLPCFLIDSRTRPGQSGSPVIFYSGIGNYVSLDGSKTLAGGGVCDLVGVYSGRVTDDSDLGIVWKADVIKDIISSCV